METSKKMGKVTMYLRSEFGLGYTRVECKECEIEVKPWAQYARGIYVTFKGKRQRNARELVQASHASIVVLEGWDHPEPPSPWRKVSETAEVTVSRGLYRSCDPRWDSDFASMLDAYIAETGARKLADFRGHDPGCR